MDMTERYRKAVRDRAGWRTPVNGSTLPEEIWKRYQ